MGNIPFQKIEVWKKSILLTKKIYKATDSFPKSEAFDLISQLRRASVSIPSNIAEGSQRGTKKDFAHFLIIAKGSLAEVQTQIILSQELGFLSEKISKDLLLLADDIGKMIYGFIKNIS